eukprot:gene39001-44103_t
MAHPGTSSAAAARAATDFGDDLKLRAVRKGSPAEKCGPGEARCELGTSL